jgi:vacuolar-type H+-ATPase subunit I/STV1
VNKSVIIVFFQGDSLKNKVKKICEGFRATMYPCPEAASERREMALGVMTRIEDLSTVRRGEGKSAADCLPAAGTHWSEYTCFVSSSLR